MRRTSLARQSKSSTDVCKRRIQAILREIVIIRDGGCVLRDYPQEASACGGWTKDGHLILQAEHLITRERNISYGDTRNVICLCKHHHGYFKQKHGWLYWELIKRVIGEVRWVWIKSVEADRKSYPMGLWEWLKVELSLQKELNELKKTK